jgi:transposase
MYLLTNLLNKRDSPDLYRLRWKIEYLFKHLKTNGYNLEDLPLKDTHKIRLMVSLVILAYILVICQGFEARKKKPMKAKKYKNQTNDTVSVFKQGQSILKQAFVTLTQLINIIQPYLYLQNLQ